MKLVKMLGFFAVLAFVGCGQEANVKEAKKDPKITIAVTCEDNLEKCGHGVVSLAPAGYPNGTTMITGIYEQNNVASRQDFGPAPITQRYGLKDGSYCFTNTNVFKPINPAAFVGTGLTPRSLVEVQKTDVCFTIKAPSDTTVPISVAIIDLDHDGNHDYSDPNPTDPCIPRTDNSACQAKQTGGGGISGIIVGNDTDNDGCVDTVGKATGWCWAVTPPTTPTVVWNPNLWYIWSRSVSNVLATKYTDPVYGVMITTTVRSGLTASDDQKFHLIDGPVTAGTNRTLSGEIICNQSGIINSVVQNANSPWNSVSPYFTTSVVANVLVTFSYPYTALNTVSSKEVQHEFGQMPAGSKCRMRNLTDQ